MLGKVHALYYEWFSNPRMAMGLNVLQEEIVTKNDLHISTGYIGIVRIYRGKNGPIVFNEGYDLDDRELVKQKVRQFIDQYSVSESF